MLPTCPPRRPCSPRWCLCCASRPRFRRAALANKMRPSCGGALVELPCEQKANFLRRRSPLAWACSPAAPLIQVWRPTSPLGASFLQTLLDGASFKPVSKPLNVDP
jgi:hypothetical protein